MTMTSLVLAGLAAVALTLTTTAFAAITPALAYQGVQDQTDTQICCPPRNTKNIKVTFKAAQGNPTAQGNGEDVAFEIQNIGSLNVAYPEIKLVARCDYREWNTWNFMGEDPQPAQYMGMAAGTPAAPFLVTCPAKSQQSVSSVYLTAEVSGDTQPSNNTAYWDIFTGGHSN